MGICRCAENKHCGIHFFKKVADVKVYKEKKAKFEKKSDRTPEFEIKDD
jgi:hypothetical protein